MYALGTILRYHYQQFNHKIPDLLKSIFKKVKEKFYHSASILLRCCIKHVQIESIKKFSSDLFNVASTSIYSIDESNQLSGLRLLESLLKIDILNRANVVGLFEFLLNENRLPSRTPFVIEETCKLIAYYASKFISHKGVSAIFIFFNIFTKQKDQYPVIFTTIFRHFIDLSDIY